MSLLPEPGQRVHLDLSGAHTFNGTCLCHIESEWNTYALVLLDCGEVMDCGALRQQPGIGWHPGAVSWAHHPAFTPRMLSEGCDD